MLPALDAKYTKELADAKAENDALRDDVAAGRRRFAHQDSHRSVREATTASGVDNAQPPPTGEHRWTGLFHPQRGWSLCKNSREPRSILMSSANGGTYIDGQLRSIVSNAHALPAGINAQSIKTEQSIYECLTGFLF